MSILGAEVADQEQRHQGEPRHGGGQTEGGAGLGGWGPEEPGGEQPAQEVEEVEAEEDSDGEEVGVPGGGLVLVLQKVPSELHPKVRNHGEGPY